MRILLIVSAIFLAFSADLSGQNDFKSLDERTYNYFIKSDFKNLEKTADTMLSQGIDYYYLRLRLGILSYNKQLYYSAFRHFSQALVFSSLDTISREYIYYSYLFSGRKADANLFLGSIASDKMNNTLRSIGKPGLSEMYIGTSMAGYDQVLYENNNLFYEAIKNSLSINVGFESFLTARFKLNMAFTNYRKDGTAYSSANPTGTGLNFVQNQLYTRLTGYVFPGWEFSGFAHFASFPGAGLQSQNSSNQRVTEYIWGLGIAKKGWKLRNEANLSVSNFGKSGQVMVEYFLTWLPSGNLNLYLTTGGMYQKDRNWGATYQISQEVGFKIFKRLWMESGFIRGNAFLYARNQGYAMNNSFQIPATTIYGNLIFLTGKKFSFTLSPYYSQIENYSYDLNALTRTARQNLDSFGGAIRLTYKIK